MSSPPLLARPSSAGQLGAAATLVRLCRSATTRASAPCCTRRAWRLSEQTRSKVPHSRLQSPFRTQRKFLVCNDVCHRVSRYHKTHAYIAGLRCAGTSSTKPKLRSVPASSTPGSTFGRSLSIGSSSGSRLCNSNRSRCSNDERRRIQTTRRVFALQPCFRRCGAHFQTQEDFLLSWRTCSRDLRKRPFRRLGF